MTPSSGRWLGLALVGAGLPNCAVINAYPFLTGALVDDRGLGLGAAGGLVGLELVVSAATAFGAAGALAGASPRRLAVAAGVLFAAGGAWSAQAAGAELLAARMLAGVGEGLALVAFGRTLAGAARPARLAGVVAALLALMGVALAIGVGAAARSGGFAGASLAIAALGAPAALLGLLSPAARRPAGAGQGRVRLDLAGLAVLGAAALTFLGGGAVWPFAERLGLGVGLTPTAVASAIGLTALAGVAGGLAATAAERLGRPVACLAAAVVLFGVCAVGLACAAGPPAYVLALAGLSFAFVFATPFLLAAALARDPGGGLAGAAQGAQMLAGAVAPALGGLALEGGGATGLAIAPAAACLLALACVLVLARAPASGPAPSPETR